MDKMENVLRALFDFQRFAGNKQLDDMIRAAEETCGVAGAKQDTSGVKSAENVQDIMGEEPAKNTRGIMGAKPAEKKRGISGAKSAKKTRDTSESEAAEKIYGMPLDDSELDVNAAGEIDAWRTQMGDKKKP